MDRKCYFVFVLVAIIAANSYAQVTRIVSNSDASADKKDPRIEKLRTDVVSTYGSLEGQGNYDRLADFTHPRSLERVGGREKFVEAMRIAFSSAKSTFSSLEVTIGKEIEIITFEGQLFGVVPRVLHGITGDNKKVVQEGTIIGISSDSGKSWKFVNGPSFTSLFPEYAGAVKVPKQRTFINGVEQND